MQTNHELEESKRRARGILWRVIIQMDNPSSAVYGEHHEARDFIWAHMLENFGSMK
jgi:hypothetical protein